MGWRFRGSIRIVRGVRLNISKSGVSASIGRRGATVNISKHGVRQTYGVPGTGISYSRYRAHGKGIHPERQKEGHERFPWLGFLGFSAVVCALIVLLARLI